MADADSNGTSRSADGGDVGASTDLDTQGLNADRAAGHWPSDIPFPDSYGSSEKVAWQFLLTSYWVVPRPFALNTGVIVRIANNSDSTVEFQVAGREKSVRLVPGKVIWLAGDTGAGELEIKVSNEAAGWGRLIFRNNVVESPNAKLAYYDQNPSDDFSIGTEKRYYCKAADHPVELDLRIKRLDHPAYVMDYGQMWALSRFPFGPGDRPIPPEVAGWALFSVSIDTMGRTAS